MPKYVVIFGSKKSIEPTSYPALFEFLKSMTHGARFSEESLGFHCEESREQILSKLVGFLDVDDQITVFEVEAAVWRLSSVNDAMMKGFLDA